MCDTVYSFIVMQESHFRPLIVITTDICHAGVGCGMIIRTVYNIAILDGY